jgi:hypothetical protein
MEQAAGYIGAQTLRFVWIRNPSRFNRTFKIQITGIGLQTLEAEASERFRARCHNNDRGGACTRLSVGPPSSSKTGAKDPFLSRIRCKRFKMSCTVADVRRGSCLKGNCITLMP